jgi:glucose/arabinose dehydrogenase
MRNVLAVLLLLATCGITAGCGEPARAEPEGESKDPAPTEKTTEKVQPLPSLDTVVVWPEIQLLEPLWVGTAPDNPRRIYVVEQGGKIKSFLDDPKTTTAEVLLDLSDKVFRGHNEEGLLALAFHPKFAENRQFYVYYSLRGETDRQLGRRTIPTRYGVLSRFTVDADDRLKTNPATEFEILRVSQPWGNHNGAEVVFGPDGMLYMSLGDGGAANDPDNHSQNLGNLLGTVIRIDVDKQDEGLRYAIPKDNPFVDRPGARPEIWAYGLRNVWRMSFDQEGNLWGGDVGQNAWEEIDIITKGGNFGWRIKEGSHPFRKDESAPDLIDPIVEYAHSNADGRSVTGGFVYRGKAIPELVGAYVYGDYQSGRVWGLRHKDGKALLNQVILDTGIRISSFGETGDGELLICIHARTGGLLKIIPKSAAAKE